jgi:hypothetical protein
MILCIAVYSIAYKLFFFYKESYAPFLSILLYYSSIFLGSDFGQIRQGFSLCFVLMAVEMAYEKKFMRFMFSALVAACFHYSSIIILPFYYLSRIQFNARRCFLLCFFSLVCSSAFLFLFPIIISMMNIPYLTEKLYLYAGSNIDIVSFLLSSFIKITVIVYYFKAKYILLKEKKQIFFFNLYIWGYGLSILFIQFPALSGRATLYFEILELILIPNIIKSIKGTERFIYCICIIFYTALCIYKNIVPYTELFIPYNISFDLRK